MHKVYPLRGPPCWRAQLWSQPADDNCADQAPCGAPRSCGRTQAAPLCAHNLAPRLPCPHTASQPDLQHHAQAVSSETWILVHSPFTCYGVKWTQVKTNQSPTGVASHAEQCKATRSTWACHLEHNLLHLLIRCLELPHKHDHDLTRVVRCIHGVHKRNDTPNALQKGCQHLPQGYPVSYPLMHKILLKSITECTVLHYKNPSSMLGGIRDSCQAQLNSRL